MMEMFLQAVAIITFFVFCVASVNCALALRYQNEIVVKGRVHHKSEVLELILVNVGLVILAVIVYYKQYIYVPAVITFVLYILLLTRMKCGLTEDGVVIGTRLVTWDMMQNFKIIDDVFDNRGTLVLQILTDGRQYFIVCSRDDKKIIKAILEHNNITQIKKL